MSNRIHDQRFISETVPRDARADQRRTRLTRAGAIAAIPCGFDSNQAPPRAPITNPTAGLIATTAKMMSRTVSFGRIHFTRILFFFRCLFELADVSDELFGVPDQVRFTFTAKRKGCAEDVARVVIVGHKFRP